MLGRRIAHTALHGPGPRLVRIAVHLSNTVYRTYTPARFSHPARPPGISALESEAIYTHHLAFFSGQGGGRHGDDLVGIFSLRVCACLCAAGNAVARVRYRSLVWLLHAHWRTEQSERVYSCFRCLLNSKHISNVPIRTCLTCEVN
jgi:hypothetical protein